MDTSPHAAATDRSAAPPRDPREERTYRILKAVVIILGVMLVGSFLVVFGTIAYRASTFAERAAARSGEPAAETLLPAPPGARIVDVAIGADKALVTIEDGRGRAVLVVDLQSYRVLRTLRLER